MNHTPDFSRQAGQVLASRYFTHPAPDLFGGNAQAQIDWFNGRMEEKEALETAIETAESADDLPPAERATWDAAYGENISFAAYVEDYGERVAGPVAINFPSDD